MLSYKFIHYKTTESSFIILHGSSSVETSPQPEKITIFTKFKQGIEIES